LSMGEEWAYFEGEGQAWFYMLQWMSWLFIPGQGFLNCLVYTRPKYLRWQRTYPKARMMWLYWKAFQMEDPPSRSSASAGGGLLTVAPSSNQEVPPGEVPVVDDPEGNRIDGVSSFTETNVLHFFISNPTVGSATSAGNVSSSSTENCSHSPLTPGQIANTFLQRHNGGSKGSLQTNQANAGSSGYPISDTEDIPESSMNSILGSGRGKESCASPTAAMKRSSGIGMDGSITELPFWRTKTVS
jgi:hypothetical protein